MKNPSNKNLFFYLGFIIFCLLLYSTRYILAPFLISFLIAYALDPLVDKLESWKLPRTTAIILFFLFILIFLVLVAFVGFPLISYQIEQLVNDFPNYIKITQQWLSPFIERVVKENPAGIKVIISDLMEKFGNIPLNLLSSATSFLWSGFSSLFSFIIALINLIIIPIACFFLLKDIDSIKEKIRMLLPARHKETILNLVDEINEVLSNFIRGQLVVSSILAVVYSGGLLLVGTPLSILIGIVAGLANIIPYLGLLIGLGPALVLTLLQYHDLTHIFGVLMVFGFAQALEGMVITPRIVGDKIGLHPVIIMLAILTGGEFFGFVGIVLAVPVAAVLSIFAAKVLEQYKKSSIFLPE